MSTTEVGASLCYYLQKAHFYSTLPTVIKEFLRYRVVPLCQQIRIREEHFAFVAVADLSSSPSSPIRYSIVLSIPDMFCEVELLRDVAVVGEVLQRKGTVLKRCIITQLLKKLVAEKASMDHGYFLSVTSLKSISKGEATNESGNVFFRVVFNCRTFLPVRGEILDGVVHHIFMHGVFLKCGPIRYAFLSTRKMPDYRYVSSDKENPLFVSSDLSKIEMGVMVRFMVLGVRWIEKRGCIENEIVMLASLDGYCLGPVSLAGREGLDL